MNKLFMILGSTALALLVLAMLGCNEKESAEEVVEPVTAIEPFSQLEAYPAPTIVVSPAVNTARELEISVDTE